MLAALRGCAVAAAVEVLAAMATDAAEGGTAAAEVPTAGAAVAEGAEALVGDMRGAGIRLSVSVVLRAHLEARGEAWARDLAPLAAPLLSRGLEQLAAQRAGWLRSRQQLLSTSMKT